MDKERLDLSVLDPGADQLRWERLVRRINEAAASELARRAALRGSVVGVLAGWARPMIAAAASVALASASVLALAGREPLGPEPGQSVAEALRIPAPVAEWVADERSPDMTDLLLALEGDLP